MSILAMFRPPRAAPHRALFLLGALQTLLAALWWLLALLGRERGAPLATPWPESALHAWFMLYGLFPFFVFGFLFTALPNWLGAAKIAPRVYLGSAGLLGAGLLSVYLGHADARLAQIGLALHLLGWTTGLFGLARIARAARHADKRQPLLVLAALSAGGLGDATYLAGALDAGHAWHQVGAGIGIWAFLVPLFLAVCHRMIPFFTSRAVANYVLVQPYRPLWLMVAASLGHGILELLGWRAWTWLADLILGAWAVWFLTRWGIARAFGDRLLAMLHIGFAWMALGFALYALDGLLGLWRDTAPLGLAPMHALLIGAFTTLLLAMATRVSLGHSGRPLRADGLVWSLFWLVQAIALARMAPDIAPAWTPGWSHRATLLLWLGVFGAWAWRFAPYYWQPRADGKPG